MLKNKKLITIAITIVAIILFIISYFLLPDTIAMQLQANGNLGNYMPKYLALLIPLAITLIGNFSFYKNAQSKYLVIALVGLLMFVLTLFMNL